MILRYPEYYEQFQCIAGECEDTCCAGWEIDIDEETYERYRQVPGEFGARLRENIKEYPADDDYLYETHGFCLKEDKRCPFLNQDNLCDLILELGEQSLCFVCANTPRNYFEYGGAREISISPSCPEAGRFIFSQMEPVRFVERESGEKFGLQESEEELLLADAVRAARDASIFLLQRRMYKGEKKKITGRLCEFLIFAGKVQEFWNQQKIEEIFSYSQKAEAGELDSFFEDEKKKLFQTFGDKEKNNTVYRCLCKRIKLFAALECVNEDWRNTLENIVSHFLDGNQEMRYSDMRKAFDTYIEEKGLEYLYEQLLAYYAFLMLPRALEDDNFMGRAQFVAVSFLMVRDMNIETFFRKRQESLKDAFTAEEFMEQVRFYAKEVEHSEENTELLEEEFLFEEEYGPEMLMLQF